MATEYKLSYTANEINQKLGMVDTLNQNKLDTSALSTHNADTSAHADIREEISQLSSEIVDIKAESLQQTPLFANSIEECTDTTKLYVLNGNLWAYMKKEVPEVTIPNFTNQIDIVGYTPDTYLSSSSGNTSAKTGYGTTGLIKIPSVASHDEGQVVLYLANIEALSTDSYVRIGFYKSDKSFNIVQRPSDGTNGYTQYKLNYWLDENNQYIIKLDLSTFIMTHIGNGASADDYQYIRICAPGLDGDSIVSLNNPIEYITTGGESVNGWVDTGHAFVPADYEDRIIKEEKLSAHFAKEIEDIKEQLAEDNGEIVVPNDTPDFIVEEAERVAKELQSTRTAKSLVFPIMSDMHLYADNNTETHPQTLLSAQYAGMGVRELKKRMHLDFTVYLGDYTWGADTYTAEQVMADITVFKETTDVSGTEIWCVGNHDVNYGKNRDRLLTTDEMYSFIGSNSDGNKPYLNIERCYGYVDFDNQKIRVIYLNTCDASDWEVTSGENARSEWISPTQIQWLASTALNFTEKDSPTEWGIVIVGHHPLHYGYSCFDSVMKILEAYKSGTDGSLSCQRNASTHETVTYSFSNTERAEIICDIHGHAHNCAFSKISSTTRSGSTAVTPWLWRFCIPNICADRYNGGYDNFTSNQTAQKNYGETDENGNPVYWEKEIGNAKATSFCIVNVDRKNRKIYAHIFGAGIDREISY